MPADGWLLHLSALPSLIINSRQRYVDNGTDQELTSRRAEFAIVGRGAVVYSFGRTFVGLNHVFNFTNTNARGEMGIISTRWQLTGEVVVLKKRAGGASLRPYELSYAIYFIPRSVCSSSSCLSARGCSRRRVRRRR